MDFAYCQRHGLIVHLAIKRYQTAKSKQRSIDHSIGHNIYTQMTIIHLEAAQQPRVNYEQVLPLPSPWTIAKNL